MIKENGVAPLLPPATSLKSDNAEKIMVTSTKAKKHKLSCGSENCSFATNSLIKMTEHRKSTRHIPSKKSSKNIVENGGSGGKKDGKRSRAKCNPSKMPNLPCQFETCDYISKYHSNLLRHRGRHGHFLNDDDKVEAEKDEVRTQIAKKIEASTSTSTTTTDDDESSELEDITVPLSKLVSPSKITDYFKPVQTKKKISQKLIFDKNVHDESKDSAAAGLNKSEKSAEKVVEEIDDQSKAQDDEDDDKDKKDEKFVQNVSYKSLEQ